MILKKVLQNKPEKNKWDLFLALMNNTVSFHTLGCRLNIFETDGLSNSFSKLGINTVQESEKPGIVIINTCTVTNRADSKNRNIIRNAIIQISQNYLTLY